MRRRRRSHRSIRPDAPSICRPASSSDLHRLQKPRREAASAASLLRHDDIRPTAILFASGDQKTCCAPRLMCRRRMQADETQLVLRCSGCDEASLERVQDVVQRHLEGFAFREKPNVAWMRQQIGISPM
ncbi:DUF2218 domain-containing protein [Microvirga roseola]|uniref:DUF2218 domain-containing protein n=1 Tax=Microvirga roseola TaxID=2883126 RepID=UPI0038994C7D